MNTILSFIVCIAMLVSPMGVLPTQPETETVWTVRNLTVGVGDESVTLAPEARVAAAVGTEEAQFHFEIGSGEDVLMPISGEINADGARFMLGTGERSYSVSDATFKELLGMDETGIAALDSCGEIFSSYAELLSVLYDAEKLEKYNEKSLELLEVMLDAKFEACEIEVNGETLSAVRLAGEATGKNILKMMDVAMNSDIPEMQAYMKAALKLFNAMEGESVEKFFDLSMVDSFDETSISTVLEFTAQEPIYSRMQMKMGDTFTEMNFDCEAIAQGEETSMTLSINLEDVDCSVNCEMDMSYTGPAEAPDDLHMDCSVIFTNSYSSYDYDAETGDVVSVFESNVSDITQMTIDASNNDGLTSAAMEMTVCTANSYGYDGEMTFSLQSVDAKADYRESLEADGSITGAFSMTVDVPDMPVEVSFELNRAESEVKDYFSGTEEIVLNSDTQDEAYMQLSADAMATAADAMMLAADDSVIALMNMLMALDEADYSIEENVSEVWADEEEEIVSVSSFEEAAEIYDGVLPDFTAPEGYALQEIVVDAYSMTAFYVSDEDSFELCTYDYDEDVSCYVLRDGALVSQSEPMVELMSYDEMIGSAIVYSEKGMMYFYFSGVEQAFVERVLAGLNEF